MNEAADTQLSTAFDGVVGSPVSPAIDAQDHQFRLLADLLPQLAWMALPDGYIYWYNQQWYSYTGTTPEQMEGWGWQSVHDPEELPTVLERWQASIKSGESFELEFPIRGANGKFRCFLTRINPVKDAGGRVVRWLGTNTDIEDQYATRQALRETQAQLAEALEAEREARLEAERAQKEAEAANRGKSDFLAMMSHELRTPLNAIAGYAELIELGIHGPVTIAQQNALDRIQRAQRHLLGLINSVLNYAKVDAGAVHYALASVVLDDVLATCEALIAPQVRARNLDLAFLGCGAQIKAFVDQEKVRQIVLNLLSNAVKFTEPGGRITLACTSDDPETVIVRVTDTGCGLEKDQLAHLFQPFVQIDAKLTRTQQGTGLGLAISRDLARAMGGELTVESEHGVGSTFTLTLPGVI